MHKPDNPPSDASPAAEKRPPTLMRHYVRYLNANILTILAGFISYPVMVRLLPTEEYGLFGYFQGFILVWIAVLKLGMQHSIRRLYPSHCLGRSIAEQKTFYTTLVLAPAALSLVLFALTLAALHFVSLFRPIADLRYLEIILVISQIGVIQSLIDNVIRAREESRLAAWLIIVGRYLELVFVVLVIVFLLRSAMGVYWARLAAVGLIFFYVVGWARRNCHFDPRSFSGDLFRQSLRFGLPLVASEISFILLAFADHVMLRYYHGNTAVGVYSIGYGLAITVGVVLRFPLEPAFQPVANRLYETKGIQPVLGLQRRVLHLLLYAVCAITAGLLAVGRDFFLLISGAEKASSAPIFVWIAVNYTLFTVLIVWTHGLTLLKRTNRILLAVGGAALLNVALNLWLIPRYVEMGAVYSTLIAYGVMGLAQVALCPRDYLPRLLIGDWLRPLALAGLMLAVAWGTDLFGLTASIPRLAAMAGVFVVGFVIPAWFIDREMREYLREKLGI